MNTNLFGDAIVTRRQATGQPAILSELDQLKRDWESDPCWDIEDTEGFEGHRAELVAYRQQKEAEWAERANAQIAEKAAALECSKSLAIHILFLERELADLRAIVG